MKKNKIILLYLLVGLLVSCDARDNFHTPKSTKFNVKDFSVLGERFIFETDEGLVKVDFQNVSTIGMESCILKNQIMVSNVAITLRNEESFKGKFVTMNVKDLVFDFATPVKLPSMPDYL